MAKKQDEFLPPARYQPPAIVPRSTFGMTRAEQRSISEFRKQMRDIEQSRIKTQAAAQAIADIDTSRFATFTDATERMYVLKQQPRPPELQGIIDRAFELSHQRLDAHLSYSADIGASLVMDTQQRPTYEETTWQEPGFFRRRLRDV